MSNKKRKPEPMPSRDVLKTLSGRYGLGILPNAYRVHSPWIGIVLYEKGLLNLEGEGIFDTLEALVYGALLPVCNDPALRAALAGCDLIEYLADSCSFPPSVQYSAQEVAAALLRLQAAGFAYIDDDGRLHLLDHLQVVKRFGRRFLCYDPFARESVEDEDTAIYDFDLDSDDDEGDDDEIDNWSWLKLPRTIICASPDGWDDAGVLLGPGGIK